MTYDSTVVISVKFYYYWGKLIQNSHFKLKKKSKLSDAFQREKKIQNRLTSRYKHVSLSI